MTRIPGTWKDKGHYIRKALVYTALVFLLPLHFIVVIGQMIEGPLDNVISGMHRWMRPCVYKEVNDTTD